MKKVPLRRCVLTNTMHPKKELLRIVKNKDGEVFIDLTSKANGRGAYLKKTVDFDLIIKKQRLLENALGIKIPSEVIEQLREHLIK